MKTVEWLGKSFSVQDEISAIAMGDFAVAASDENGSNGMAAMAAMMGLLQDSVDPADWKRFHSHAKAKRATFENLTDLIQSLTAESAERPTGRQSDSLGGLPATEPKSVLSYDGKVSDLFPGRPDLQAAILRGA